MGAMNRPKAPRRVWWPAVVSLLLAGCASYEMAPLAANHPAHPEAVAPAEPAASQTLAYSQADVPRSELAAAVPHEGHRAAPTEAEAPSRVVGEGEVIATVPNASQLVVDHGEIKGFMEPMTMGYRVDPVSLLAGLKQGDKVRFTIDVQRRAIVEIEKLP